MIAYKFLRSGAVGPFTGFNWPTPQAGKPGPWVEADTPLQLCLSGIHACRVEQLPHWIEAELWQVELGQPVHDAGEVLVSMRGRLVRRVARWDATTVRDFETACGWRSRDHAVAALRSRGHTSAASSLAGAASLEEVATRALQVAEEVEGATRHALEYTVDLIQVAGHGNTSLVAWIANRAAQAAEVARGDTGTAEADERHWQAAWLAERLDLLAV